MTTIKIPAKQARIQFGELLERARWGNERFLITKKAKPLAYIMNVQDVQALEEKAKAKTKMKKRFPFKAYDLGTFKTPLTRKYMYDERLDKTLGY